MTRWPAWLVTACLGHVAGSCGTVALGGFAFGVTAPPSEWLDAPVRAVPLMVWATYPRTLGGQPLPLGDRVAVWAFYLVPFAAVLVISPLVACLRRRRLIAPEGFTPILSGRPADAAGGSGRQD